METQTTIDLLKKMIMRIYAEPQRLAKTPEDLDTLLRAYHQWLADLLDDDAIMYGDNNRRGFPEDDAPEESYDTVVDRWRFFNEMVGFDLG